MRCLGGFGSHRRVLITFDVAVTFFSDIKGCILAEKTAFMAFKTRCLANGT